MVPDKWNQNWHFITTYNLIIPGTCYMYIFEKWWYEILFSCWIYKPQCVGLHFGVWIGMWGILWRWVSSSRLDQRSRSAGRSSPLYWRFLWWPGLYDVCLYWFGFLLWHWPMEELFTWTVYKLYWESVYLFKAPQSDKDCRNITVHMGDQFQWILWVTITHEFTSSQTC